MPALSAITEPPTKYRCAARTAASKPKICAKRCCIIARFLKTSSKAKKGLEREPRRGLCVSSERSHGGFAPALDGRPGGVRRRSSRLGQGSPRDGGGDRQRTHRTIYQGTRESRESVESRSATRH